MARAIRRYEKRGLPLVDGTGRGNRPHCQGKVEMSYSLQSRNVLFCRGGDGVRVILAMPVKRRRAMLASNPVEE